MARRSSRHNNLTLTLVGAALLWTGWFGFNVGSNLEANGIATLTFINTFAATCMAAVTWIFAEWAIKGEPSMLGGVSGAIAGLVAITPACGYVGVMGSLAIGLAAGLLCLWGVNGLKRLLGMDDSLDVFGIHGVGGILGALLTGVFVSPSLGGTGVYDYAANKVGHFDMSAQMISQLWGVGTSIAWSGVVSWFRLSHRSPQDDLVCASPRMKSAEDSTYRRMARARITHEFKPPTSLQRAPQGKRPRGSGDPCCVADVDTTATVSTWSSSSVDLGQRTSNGAIAGPALGNRRPLLSSMSAGS